MGKIICRGLFVPKMISTFHFEIVEILKAFYKRNVVVHSILKTCNILLIE